MTEREREGGGERDREKGGGREGSEEGRERERGKHIDAIHNVKYVTNTRMDIEQSTGNALDSSWCDRVQNKEQYT